MKKLSNPAVLLTILLLTATAIWAFKPPKVGPTEEYCMLHFYQKGLSNKVVIEIDYGQKRPFMKDNSLKDAAGNPINFNSVVDAMNYLNEDGWVYINPVQWTEPGVGRQYNALVFSRRLN